MVQSIGQGENIVHNVGLPQQQHLDLNHHHSQHQQPVQIIQHQLMQQQMIATTPTAQTSHFVGAPPPVSQRTADPQTSLPLFTRTPEGLLTITSSNGNPIGTLTSSVILGPVAHQDVVMTSGDSVHLSNQQVKV